MKIIVDAMGGDNAPEAIVKGSVYARDRLGVDITFVGRREDIERCLGDTDRKGIEIVDAREVVTMDDGRTGHAITFYGRDGDMIYIEELGERYMVVGGKAVVRVADAEWFQIAGVSASSAQISLTDAYRQARPRCPPRSHGAGAAQP